MPSFETKGERKDRYDCMKCFKAAWTRFAADKATGEIGPDLFRRACLMGLEGLVSKHRDRPYRGGRQKHWIKVKNPAVLVKERARFDHRIARTS